MTTAYDYGGAPVMFPTLGTYQPANSSALQTIQTMDATGEACHLVGQIFIDGRPTGAKTLSSAGGKIHYMVGAKTFAAAGTTLRVGIQDVDMTNGPAARGDGTFDVYKDLVGATDTITANAYNTATLANGTKSITHGDLIAIVFNMTARAGADSVIIQGLAQSASSHFHLPQCTAEVPAGTFVTAVTVPNAVIEFDDGTLGWIYGTMPVDLTALSTVSFDSASTPDEYGGTVKFDRPVVIDGLWAQVTMVGSGPTEFILYEDPLGTPAAVSGGTYSFDHDIKQVSGSQRFVHIIFPVPIKLKANTKYGICVRPTTADNVDIFYLRVANANFLKVLPGGVNSTFISRTDNSGVFTETNTRRLHAGVLLAGGDDGQGPLPTYQLGV